jgi:hypothetical protein
MDSIKINGQEHPFLFSLRAIKDYQDRLLKAGEETTSAVDEVQVWIELGLKYGAKASQSSLSLDSDDIINWMDANFEDALEISAKCRQQLVRFNQAMTGQQMAESSKNGAAKKKKVTN